MVSIQLAALVLAVSGVGETVLLDFNAPWCGPCRSMDSTISQLEASGLPVRKVNIDQEPDLARRYQVTNIPCFVMVADGHEVDRVVGATSLEHLKGMFAKAGAQPAQGGHEIARGQSPDRPMRRRLLGGNRAASSTGADPFATASTKPSLQGPPLTALPSNSNPANNMAAKNAAPASAPSAGADPFAASVNSSPRSSGGPSSSELIKCNVRLKIEDSQGFSYGSGTMIDTRGGDVLILTCGHIFRDSKGKGKITVDMFGPGAPKGIEGQLIGYEYDKRDIGLVSIRPGCAVKTAHVAPKGYQLAKGDKVTSVGCNNGSDPTAIESHVTSIDKFLGAPNVQVAGQPVQGRSGGGLFSADGLVVGVCNAADPTDNEGLFAAPATIQLQLDEAKLASVYSPLAARCAAALASTTRSNDVASAAPAPPAMPQKMPVSSSQHGLLATADRAPAANGLNAVDQKTVDSLLNSQANGAEVICIVRDPSDPNAKSQVVVINKASGDFLQQLANERRSQEGRQLTALEAKRPSKNFQR